VAVAAAGVHRKNPRLTEDNEGFCTDPVEGLLRKFPHQHLNGLNSLKERSGTKHRQPECCVVICGKKVSHEALASGANPLVYRPVGRNRWRSRGAAEPRSHAPAGVINQRASAQARRFRLFRRYANGLPSPSARFRPFLDRYSVAVPVRSHFLLGA